MKSRRGCVVGRAVIVVLAAGLVAAVGAKARAGEGQGERRRSSADDARALSATIDRLIEARWQEAGVTPAPAADDAEFLRRVALDLSGKIASAGEVRDFLDDPRPDRRERLVDRLLDGPAFIAHTTRVETHALIPEAESGQLARFLVPSFEAWLRDQVADNVGVDRIVRAILTAAVADERDQGMGRQTLARYQVPSLLPYYVAKEVKAENLAASTARTFLGLRLECAQCHNHPFASWTRDQFWGYAAFFAGLEKRGPGDAIFSMIRELPDRREAAIPGTERVVQAAYLDGSEPNWRPGVSARAILADWITSPDNPYFARAAVNRAWAQLFGIGLVDPVDDMGADNPPSHPELLDALARDFAAHGFDRKYLLRAIVLSRPYQLTSLAARPDTEAVADAGEDADADKAEEATPGDGNGNGTVAEDLRLFERMRVRGLSAEQLYDSVAQAIGMEPEESSPARSFNVVGSPRSEFLERFARLDEKSTEAQMSILQALTLMNGRLVAEATRASGQRTVPAVMTGTLGASGDRTLAAVAQAPFLDTAGRVETLFLAVLGRRPTSTESARLVGYVKGHGPTEERKALSDVFWALLNSPEFVLNH